MKVQADRPRRQAVRRLDGDRDLRQVGRVHLRRLERAGDQGVLLEVAAAPPPADRVEPRPRFGQPGPPNDAGDGRPRRLRRRRWPRRWPRRTRLDAARSAMGGGMASAWRVARCGGMGGMAGGMGGGMRDGGGDADGRAAAEMADGSAASAAAAAPRRRGRGPGGAAAWSSPTVRTKFADTALWVGALTTDADGTAEVALDMPENLTTWQIKVWGMGHGTTRRRGRRPTSSPRKNLIVRLQAPRFFVAEGRGRALGQRPQLPEDARSRCSVALELDGRHARSRCERARPQTVDDRRRRRSPRRLAREGRRRGRGRRPHEGPDRRRVGRHGDAVPRATSTACSRPSRFSGAIRPDEPTRQVHVQRAQAERRPEQSRLEVRYSPTLAGAMVDALPYLVDYPYGCTEQTLNRFLPTVITQKVLLRHGARPEGRSAKKRTNLNAQEIGDDREAGRAAGSATTATRSSTRPKSGGWSRTASSALTEMQLSDGGWGWFSRLRRALATPHTTADVVHGLQIAQAERRGPRARRARARRRVAQALPGRAGPAAQERRREAREDEPWKEHADNLDALVYMVLVDAGVDERRDARLPLPRPHRAGRLRQGDVRPGPATSRATRRSSP